MPDGDGRGPVLLSIAREAIEQHDPTGGPFTWEQEWLRRPGATFVTLRLEGELRGCIGSIDPRRLLGDDVHANARAAAYRDPRFPPVSADERPHLAIEVSVLSPRERVACSTEVDAVALLRPGIDGVYFEFHDLASTFLPQVWSGIPDPFEFLGELKRKAGLPMRFWHPDVKLSRYTVEKYT